MKTVKVFLVILFLSGCESQVNRFHLMAKTNSGDKVCYDIVEHSELTGRYCLEYVGHTK